MKSSSLFLRVSSLLAFSTVFALLASGCQASPDDLCRQMCSCSKTCTAQETDQCVSYYEQYQKLATDAGCGSEFQAALSCGASGHCEADGYTTECEKEGAALSACEKKANGGG